MNIYLDLLIGLIIVVSFLGGYIISYNENGKGLDK